MPVTLSLSALRNRLWKRTSGRRPRKRRFPESRIAALIEALEDRTLLAGVWSSFGEATVSGNAITMGVADRGESDQQPSGVHGAYAALAPAASYEVSFDFDLSTWDSYNDIEGYWDSFSVSVTDRPYAELGLTDPVSLPFVWGGGAYQDTSLETNVGSQTITVAGDSANPRYLNVVLDSAAAPQADGAYPSWGTVTITAMPATTTSVSITANDTTAAETVDGQQADTGQFTVTRSGDTSSELMVEFTVSGSALYGSTNDYTSSPAFTVDANGNVTGSVTIPAGQSSTTITVSPVDDTTAEPDEEIVVTLNDGSGYAIGLAKSDTVTILDNDGGGGELPNVTISSDPLAGGDRNTAEEGQDVGVFVVTRTGETTAELVVNFGAVSNKPADQETRAEREDYELTPSAGSVTIPAGQSSVTITVTPKDDAIAELAEELWLELHQGAGYVVGDGNQDYVTIDDNEDWWGSDVRFSNVGGFDCACSCGCDPVEIDPFSGKVTFETAAALGVAGSAFLPRYGSNENPHPIVGVDLTLPTATLPAEIDAQLTFGGLVQPVKTYSVLAGSEGQTVRLALQADATTLSSGHHEYTVDIRLKFPTETAGVYRTETQTFSGSSQIFNRSNSEFGKRWWVPGLDRLDVDASGVAVLRGNGTSAYFANDGAGGFVTPEGSFSTFVQLANGGYSLTLPDGSRKHFDVSGRLSSEQDRNGVFTAFEYVDGDGDGRNDELSRVDAPRFHTLEYNYSGGRLASLNDSWRGIYTFAYDPAGLVTSMSAPDPDGTGPQTASMVSFDYDAGTSLLTSMTNPLGGVTSFTYGSDLRLRSITGPDGATSQIEPLQTKGLTALVLDRDAQAVITDPAGNVSRIHMDRFGNTLSSIDALGRTTTYERDANGRVTLETRADPDGTGPAVPSVTSYTYDAQGRLTGMTLPDGATPVWTYDPDSLPQNPTSFTDELGRVTTYSYDADGNLLSETDALGNITSYTYTTFGQLDSVTLPEPGGVETHPAPKTSYLYDEFTSPGRLVTITNPDGTTRHFTYNQDNIASETDELGRMTSYGYDALGRRTSMTDPAGSVTTYDYNALGLLTKATLPDPDAGGPRQASVYQFSYDTQGRLTKETDPLGNAVSYAYDNLGRTASVTDARAQATSYGYDAVGNLISITEPDPDGTGPLTSPVTRFGYDALNRMTSTIDPRGYVTTTAYDALDRVSSVTDALGNVTSYSYDAVGNLLSETDGLGRATQTPTIRSTG